MSRLVRVIEAFKKYDEMVEVLAQNNNDNSKDTELAELREEVKTLIIELKSYGCRREENFCRNIKTFKVYGIKPTDCYTGASFVGANNLEEANDYIRKFKESDIDNKLNSEGYKYLEEKDIVNGVSTQQKGFISYGIRHLE